MDKEFDARSHDEKEQEIEREVIKYIDQKIKQRYDDAISDISPIGNLSQTSRFVKGEMEKQEALERKFEKENNDRDNNRDNDRDLDFFGKDGRDF